MEAKMREKGSKNGTEEDQQQSDGEILEVDTKRAVMGGVIAAIAVLMGTFLINVGSGSDPRLLLEGMLPSVRSLCSAVMTASSTILALMLTMLSMSSSNKTQFKADYYERARQIAWVDTAVLITAILLLSLISIPLSDSQDVPQNWYLIWYYVVLVGTAVLSSSLISVVMMLYNAVKGLIRALHPREESQLVKNKSQGA
jgi:hypothetical protein